MISAMDYGVDDYICVIIHWECLAFVDMSNIPVYYCITNIS